jgi:hypothetical protein
MTVLELLDDAVKIGLGSFIGWWMAKSGYSHDFEKERRRRKQDCLERVMEDLDDTQSTLEDWSSLCLTYRTLAEKKEDPKVMQVCLKGVNAKSELNEAARSKLLRSQSKLVVFGFDGCAKSLLAYNAKLLLFKVDVNAVRCGEKGMDIYAPGLTDLRKSVTNFRESVAKAFASL